MIDRNFQEMSPSVNPKSNAFSEGRPNPHSANRRFGRSGSYDHILTFHESSFGQVRNVCFRTTERTVGRGISSNLKMPFSWSLPSLKVSKVIDRIVFEKYKTDTYSWFVESGQALLKNNLSGAFSIKFFRHYWRPFGSNWHILFNFKSKFAVQIWLQLQIFFKWTIPGLFFFISVFSIQKTNVRNKSCLWLWFQTADICHWKKPRYQLSQNHCP